MQMIEALENDSIVVPDQFLEELSSKVDEFEHMLGLSKEETNFFCISGYLHNIVLIREQDTMNTSIVKYGTEYKNVERNSNL